MRTGNVKERLCKCVVSIEPSLFEHSIFGQKNPERGGEGVHPFSGIFHRYRVDQLSRWADFLIQKRGSNSQRWATRWTSQRSRRLGQCRYLLQSCQKNGCKSNHNQSTGSESYAHFSYKLNIWYQDSLTEPRLEERTQNDYTNSDRSCETADWTCAFEWSKRKNTLGDSYIIFGAVAFRLNATGNNWQSSITN